MDALGGAQRGKFFSIVAPWVDVTKRPGDTPLPRPSAATYLLNAVKLRHFWASPNLVWFTMCVVFYICCPYNMDLGRLGL